MTKTILMIHGFGAAGESWAPVAARFKSAGYTVEAPTIQAALRTVGAPPAGLAGKTLSDYVGEMSDLAEAIATRDGIKPVVFGHSMGGLIAQKLAEAGLVSGAVLFAPASPADARGKPSLSALFTFLNIVAASKPETKAVKIWRTGFLWGVLNKTPPERREAIFATTVHDSGQVLTDLAYPERDPRRTAHVDASKVTAPVLILGGAQDRTTPIADLRLVAKKYAGSTFKEYPNNGHWLVDEPGSAGILADVAAWLDAKGLGVKAPVVTATPAPAAKAAAPKAEPAKPVVAAAPVPAAKPAPKAKAPASAKTAPASKAPAKTDPAPKAAAPKAAPAPKVVKAAPAPKAATSAPKAPSKPAAKAAPAPKAKTPVKAVPVATPAAAPAKTAAKPPAKAKAVPAPKAAPAAKPAPAPKPEAAKAKPAAAPTAAKAPAKAVSPKPKAAAPAAKDTAVRTPAAKAPAAKAPAKAANPAPKVAPTKVKSAAAKPAAAKAPAATKAAPPAKTPAKAPATKSTAKSSPSAKKSV
uniref:Arylesterase-related protein n=1 Tax=Caulobacter sp. (strain K31) TaxID=366602 RepID=B0T326_CAUSK